MRFSTDARPLQRIPRRKLIAQLGGSRGISVVTMLILYWLLGLLFDEVVASRYTFGSFQINYRDDTWIEILTVILAGFILPVNPRRMSEIFAWLSTVFLLVPAAVLSAYQGSDRGAMFMMFGGVWLVMLLCRLLNKSNLFRLNWAPSIAKADVPVLLAILFGVLALLAFHVRGAFNLSMLSVYDFRYEFNESLTFPLNYLFPFAAGPLNGFLVSYLLYRKNYKLILIPFVLGLLFFGFSTHKSMMFYPFFSAIIYFAITSRAGHLYLMVLFIILTILTFYLAGTELETFLGSTFANRLVFIPAQIHYYFFLEFGEIGPQFWAESRLSLGLAKSDLPLPSVNYIGLSMTGDAVIGANTGWLANGYMNGWIAGIMLYAVILATTLHVIDRLGERYGQGFVGAGFVIPIFGLVNSMDLLAGFLTGGLALLFIVVFVLVRPEARRDRLSVATVR